MYLINIIYFSDVVFLFINIWFWCGLMVCSCLYGAVPLLLPVSPVQRKLI